MAPTNPNSGCDQQQQWRRPTAARFHARDRHLEHICGNFKRHVVVLPRPNRHSPMRNPQAAFEVLRRLRYRSLLSLSPQDPRPTLMPQQTSPCGRCRRHQSRPFLLCRIRVLCLLPPALSRTYPPNRRPHAVDIGATRHGHLLSAAPVFCACCRQHHPESPTYPSAAISPRKRHMYLGFASRRILCRTLCRDNAHRVLLKGELRGGRQWDQERDTLGHCGVAGSSERARLLTDERADRVGSGILEVVVYIYRLRNEHPGTMLTLACVFVLHCFVPICQYCSDVCAVDKLARPVRFGPESRARERYIHSRAGGHSRRLLMRARDSCH